MLGSSRRTVACTQMNSESSRSHLICVWVVKLENRRTQATSIGKLTLVDLAGSEVIFASIFSPLLCSILKYIS